MKRGIFVLLVAILHVQRNIFSLYPDLDYAIKKQVTLNDFYWLKIKPEALSNSFYHIKDSFIIILSLYHYVLYNEIEIVISYIQRRKLFKLFQI